LENFYTRLHGVWRNWTFGVQDYVRLNVWSLVFRCQFGRYVLRISKRFALSRMENELPENLWFSKIEFYSFIKAPPFQAGLGLPGLSLAGLRPRAD